MKQRMKNSIRLTMKQEVVFDSSAGKILEMQYANGFVFPTLSVLMLKNDLGCN